MVDALAADEPPSQEFLDGFSTMSKEIDRHVNDIVTGLQFQDMTRQLIERSLKRVIGLRAMMGALGSSSLGMYVDGGSEQVVPLIRSINKQLSMQNQELQEMLMKTVRQKHMDSGDIELF
jgi:hypothetical protein